MNIHNGVSKWSYNMTRSDCLKTTNKLRQYQYTKKNVINNTKHLNTKQEKKQG